MDKKEALAKIKCEIEKIIGIPLSCTFYISHLLFKKQDNIQINNRITEYLVSFSMRNNYQIHIVEWNEFFNKIYLNEPVNLSNLDNKKEIVINPNMILYDH